MYPIKKKFIFYNSNSLFQEILVRTKERTKSMLTQATALFMEVRNSNSITMENMFALHNAQTANSYCVTLSSNNFS